MSDSLIPIPKNVNMPVSAQNVYSGKNQVFGDVGAIHSTVNIIGTDSTMQPISLSMDFCNIIIAKDERFEGQKGSFTLLKKRAAHYNLLSEAERDKVYSYPTLFFDINDGYRECTNPEQQFFYGLVTRVIEQGKYYKVHYQKLSVQPLYQNDLNKKSVELGINKNNGIDIFVKSSWIIMKMDIRKALINVGIHF